MEFLLKRIPACSRALGELDSEDESTDDELTETNGELILSDGLTVHLESVSTTRLVIALGPIQTAFVTCCFRLSPSSLLGTLSYPSPSYNVTNRVAWNSLCIYHSSELHPGTLIVTVPCGKQDVHLVQKTVANTFMNLVLGTDLRATVLCDEPIHRFQTQSEPNAPVIRMLANESSTGSHSLPFPSLEQPNILSGYAAEFFSFAVLRSIPTTLFVLYYANSYDPRYAWHGAKELFDQLYPIQYFLGEIPQMAEHMWDATAYPLKEDCISALSGNKPSLTDQMYT
ncbi:hypothetical protein CRM22_010520 [Opisthorchis felineus]|uniref:Proteasome assembly chaperone 1 n=1 Tax=Opisthorchis felineus TaxID=147828 RepID=A0A4S2KY07_OPIFE|nr:hypothetical protein CRM22_010520 [Opisthorchis felineus]